MVKKIHAHWLKIGSTLYKPLYFSSQSSAERPTLHNLLAFVRWVREKTKNRKFHFNFHVRFGFSVENGVKSSVIALKGQISYQIEGCGQFESESFMENRR